VVELHLYVEGGGDAKVLRTACRRGFSEFLARAGLKGHLPRIVACGGRRQAYDDFCTALRQNRHTAMLLVDSEDPVTVSSPWIHLLQRPGDAWPTPLGATDDACHLMVQCMESWLLADRDTLRRFFGQGFNPSALPPASNPIETIPKGSLYPRSPGRPGTARQNRLMQKESIRFACWRWSIPQRSRAHHRGRIASWRL
jgi:hypothetical protein